MPDKGGAQKFPGRTEVLDRLRLIVSRHETVALDHGSTHRLYTIALERRVITPEDYASAEAALGHHWRYAE